MTRVNGSSTIKKEATNQFITNQLQNLLRTVWQGLKDLGQQHRTGARQNPNMQGQACYINLAQCQLCCTQNGREDTYFGHTLVSHPISQFTSVSMATVCSKFILKDRKIYEHSALSMHCYIKHKNTFNFETLIWDRKENKTNFIK